TTELWFVTAGGGTANSIDHADNTGTNTPTNKTTLYSKGASDFNHPTDIALDPVDGLYFFVDSDGFTDRIRVGTLAQAVGNPNANPTFTTLYTKPTTPTNFGTITAWGLDISNKIVYFAQTDPNGTPVSFHKVNFDGTGSTTLATISTPTVFLSDMALDLPHGTAYFTAISESVGFGGTIVGE